MSEIKYTAFGLTLEADDEDYDLTVPMEVVAVVKGLDSAGKVSYWVIKTPDLSNIEAWGMSLFGARVAERSACE